MMVLDDIFYHYRMQSNSVMHTLDIMKRGEGIHSAIEQIGELLEEVEDDWESGSVAYLVCRYVENLMRIALQSYMLADSKERLRSKELYSHLIDDTKRYYKSLRIKIKLCAKYPYSVAPFYRFYRSILRTLKGYKV